MDSLVFFVNGRKVVEPSADPLLSLLNYLRNTLHLTGSKKACEEGGCGSCTVLLSKYDQINKKIRHHAVVACLVPLCSVHGCAVTTIEGIGTTRTGLHPVQKRLVESHGLQCGYCSPGMVMSMVALLKNNPTPTQRETERALEGNLCRCTGYRPILDAFKSFCGEEGACVLGEQCCKVDGPQVNKDGSQHAIFSPYVPCDPSQSSIFPSELQIDHSYHEAKLSFTKDKVTWLRPTTLKQLLHLRQMYPESLLVTGSTKTAFQVRQMTDTSLVLIYPMEIKEMLVTERTEKGLTLGADLTITDALKELELCAEHIKEYEARSLNMVKNLWEKIGSEQLRNMVTIGGSVATANFNSDVIVPLAGAGAQITIISPDSEIRTVRMDADLFSNSLLKCGDVILSIHIPFSDEHEVIHGFKQSWRHAVDRAIVNASFRVHLDVTSNTVLLATLSLGGVGPKPILATETEAVMIGRQWTDDLVEEVCQSLTKELHVDKTLDHRQYRQTLALSFFFKFSWLVNQHLAQRDNIDAMLSESVLTCGREVSRGTQVWEEVPPDQPKEDPVGRPVSHRYGKQLSTGEALFYSDMPAREDEVFLALVRSSKAHAKILSIDHSQALKMPGVIGYVDHKDVPGSNKMGLLTEEEIFAVSEVFFVGQIICGIAAVGEHQARAAAKKVIIEYEELPTIFTIEEAITAGSFFNERNLIATKGNVDVGMNESDEVIEGTMRVGCQDHFYMETQCSVVVPVREVEEYHVYSGTQNVSDAQLACAETLGIPCNKVYVHQKRLGGAFGGKEFRPSIGLLLQPAAVAAHKFQSSVRCQLTRKEDITTTGGRHPYLAKYKAGYTREGLIRALDIMLYSNAGASVDISGHVARVSIHTIDGGYNIPHVKCTARLAKTNKPTPTSMRGFGNPQACICCEEVVDRIANRLGMETEQVRELNMSQDGDYDLAGKPLTNCNLKRCWNELKEKSSLVEWRQGVDEFNGKSSWKKRGLAAVAIKVPVGFGKENWNQAGAFVNVYKDGSVLLAHSGVEMGQGLNTKMIQIASRVLGISQDLIYTDETSSKTVPNTLPTVGSMGTDWNGPAVIDACEKIINRLKPIKEANPTGSWAKWVDTAFRQRISLSATGFNSFPEEDVSDYDPRTKRGCWARYYTYGAVCSEVEVDCLTGEHIVHRTDIVMDVGKSINPAIDVGQIEGAFMQGLGLYTIEEITYDEDGMMLTQGPDSYKIPTVTDIPVSLNISILKGVSNPKAVYSSKGIGEPPYLLATSVFFAIKNSIRAFRKEGGLSNDFRLDSPATAERIRMACEDKFTKMACGGNDAIPKWNA